MRQKAKHLMTVTRDINLGSLIPLVLFLVGQTSLAIWWASDISSAIEDIKADISAQAAEDLRQWSRINGLETTLQAYAVSSQAMTERLVALTDRVDELRADVRDTNALLRRYLTANGVAQ